MKPTPVCVSGMTRVLVAVWIAGQAVATAQQPGAAAEPSHSVVLRAPTSDEEVTKAEAAAKASDPKTADSAWTRLGDAYMQKGRETADVSYYGRAESAYRRALTSNAKSIGALVGMAWVEGGRHEFEHSIEWANKALALDPNRADCYGLLGDAAVEMGDYDKAFTHYQKMLDLRPDISSYSRGAHLLF